MNRLKIAFTDIEIEEPKPYTYTECNSVNKYNQALEAGYYIRDGFWFVDDYNAVAKATQAEMNIASLFSEYIVAKPQKPRQIVFKLKTYNRLGMLNK